MLTEQEGLELSNDAEKSRSKFRKKSVSLLADVAFLSVLQMRYDVWSLAQQDFLSEGSFNLLVRTVSVFGSLCGVLIGVSMVSDRIIESSVNTHAYPKERYPSVQQASSWLAPIPQKIASLVVSEEQGDMTSTEEIFNPEDRPSSHFENEQE